MERPFSTTAISYDGPGVLAILCARNRWLDTINRTIINHHPYVRTSTRQHSTAGRKTPDEVLVLVFVTIRRLIPNSLTCNFTCSHIPVFHRFTYTPCNKGGDAIRTPPPAQQKNRAVVECSLSINRSRTDIVIGLRAYHGSIYSGGR